MKPILFHFLIFCTCICFAQQEEFSMQGQIVDSDNNPISNAYIINFRTQKQRVSRNNGVFDIWLLPSDSMVISHVSYMTKVISTFDLQRNPIIVLELDTVEINQVSIYGSRKTEYDRAMENIEAINWDPRPSPYDAYTESERMKQLLQYVNKEERAAASSLTYSFSPTAVIGFIVEKIKRRKKSNQYYSKKKVKKSKDQK